MSRTLTSIMGATMKTSSVLTDEVRSIIDNLESAARSGACVQGSPYHLVSVIHSLVAVAEAARVHMTRTDTRHTPACRPSMKDNQHWCSTCNLMRALDELEKP